MKRKGLKSSQSVLLFALACGLPIVACAPVTPAVVVSQTDISSDVYKLLLKELFAELSISSEAQDIKALNSQFAAQTPDEKFQILKKLNQRTRQLYMRLSNELKALNPPEDLKAIHQQSTNLLTALSTSNDLFERILSSDRANLLKNLQDQPAQIEASLLGVLQSYIKPESKATIKSLGTLGITYQSSEPVLSELDVKQYWEKSDQDLLKASQSSAKAARSQLLSLLLVTSGDSAVPSQNLPIDTSTEAQLIQIIQDNANALNEKDVVAFQASLHPHSQLHSYMPNLFAVLLQFKTSYRLNKIMVEAATGSDASVQVSRSTTDISGSKEHEIRYHLRKFGNVWRIFSMDVKSEA